MTNTINNENHPIRLSSGEVNSFWTDELFHRHYSSYYEKLTPRQLDDEFFKDMNMLVNILNKLPKNERKIFIETFSQTIELYIENKIEKEIDFSFHKMLNF